jgi:membrane protein required for colicin V production
LNFADYIIVGILALSVLMGLWRGFVAEALALVCWVVAFWVAWTVGPVLAEQLSVAISVPSVRVLLGFSLCFVAVLGVGAIVAFIMRKLVDGSGLSGSDRLLGMVFGFARGAALVTLLVFLVGFTPFSRDPWWQESRLLPGFSGAARWLGERVPAEVAAYLMPAGGLAVPAMDAADSPANPPVGGNHGAPADSR